MHKTRNMKCSLALILFVVAGLRPAFGSDEGDTLGGPESVSEQASFQHSDAFMSDYRLFPEYSDWKAGLKEKHGLSYGFGAWFLPQLADDSPTEEDSALSAVYRFSSTLDVGREWRNPGKIELRIENRSALGSNISATDLSSELGISALNPGFIYSDNFDWDYSVLNWTQIFRDQRLGYAIGRLAFDAYQDTYYGQTISGNLLNRAFIVNPAIATAGIGALGAVVKGFVSDHVWLGGQIFDANAQNGEFDSDTVREGEWLKSFEIGWTPESSRFKSDRYMLTWWQKDERTEAGVPKGEGWAFTAARSINSQLNGFLRYGHSDGGAGVAARNAASMGFQYFPRKSQSLSVGVGWAEPSDRTLRDEYVVEAGYKMAVTPQLSVMPDLQVVFDPAENPAEDSIWLFSLRTILTF